MEHLLSEKRIRDIDVNCPNKHGITPMYLAKFIGGDSCESDSPWCKVVEVIMRNGGTLRYPPLESEYFLFHMFHKRFANRLYLHLTEEEMALLQDNRHHDCQNDTTMAVDDLLKAYDDVERVVSDYQDKRDECVELKENCPIDYNRLPHVDYVLLLLDEQRQLKTSFFLIRNCFTNFLVNEVKQVRELLCYTIDGYSGIFTKDSLNISKRRKSKIELKAREDPQFIGVNTCSRSFGIEMKSGLHYTYINYKQHLDFVLEDLNQVKSVINRKLPSFFAKMDTALRNFETALNCDWQAVSVKYVQLEFYLRNLQQIWMYQQTTLQLPVSDFLSHRVKNVLLKPSDELLKLILRLASKQPSDSFRYLASLRFLKPPLWQDKDKLFK